MLVFASVVQHVDFSDPPARRSGILPLDARGVSAVLTAYLCTRLIVLVAILLSRITIPVRPTLVSRPLDNLILDGLIRNGAAAYLLIARDGYGPRFAPGHVPAIAVYFPVYPMLIHLVTRLSGTIYLAGVLISHVAFLIALVFLYLLARDEFDHPTAARSVLYLAAAPAAVFFSAVYTESLFLLLVAVTFYAARHQRWVIAALAGGLASATRNTGVLLAAVVALEGLHQQGVRWRPPGWRPGVWARHLRAQLRRLPAARPSLLAAACVPLGLLAYMAYLGLTFGDPLGFIHAQSTFGRDVSGGGLSRFFAIERAQLRIGANFWAGQVDGVVLLDLLLALACVPLIVVVGRTMRPAYTVFVALSFVIPISTGTTSAMLRYSLLFVPCYMLLARWGGSPRVDRLVLGIFMPLLAVCAVLVSHAYPPL